NGLCAKENDVIPIAQKLQHRLLNRRQRQRFTHDEFPESKSAVAEHRTFPLPEPDAPVLKLRAGSLFSLGDDFHATSRHSSGRAARSRRLSFLTPLRVRVHLARRSSSASSASWRSAWQRP